MDSATTVLARVGGGTSARAQRRVGGGVALLLGGTLGLSVCVGASAQYAFPNGRIAMGGEAIAVGDVNGDGVIDFVTADADANAIRVALRGSPAFDLAQYDAGNRPGTIALGDVDGDGDLDAVTTGIDCVFDDLFVNFECTSRTSVLFNDGQGVFSAPTHTILDAPPPNVEAANPAWVELGDLDGDGDLDMAIADGEANAIALFNDGAGAFGNRVDAFTGLAPNQVALGDLDGDSDLDMAVANLNSGDTSVFLNDGTGAFGPESFYISGANQGTLVLGDLNGDGHLDLVTADTGGGSIGGAPSGDSVFVLLGAGDGSFGAPTPYLIKSDPAATNPNPIAVDLGDFNADGHLDIVSIHQFSDESAGVLLNTGNGTFAPVVIVARAAAGSFDGGVVTDVDGNGTADILAVGSGVAAILGKGDGTFWTKESYPVANAAALDGADVDGDGDTDIIGLTDRANGQSALLINDGAGGFTSTAIDIVGTGIRFADMDGDGDPDYVLARGFSNLVGIAINNGGTFAAPIEYPVAASWKKIEVADLNGDARPDVVTIASPVSVLLNQGDGTLAAATPYAEGGIESGDLGDIDNDGDVDIVLAENGGPNATRVLINAGNGTFAEPADAAPIANAFVRDVALGDFDGDGNLDLVAPNGTFFDDQLLFRYGNGDGAFGPAVSYAHPISGLPEEVEVADLDQDGLLDIIVGSDGNAVVCYNLGGRAFTPAVPHDAGRTQTADLLVAELNGDNTPDLAVSTWFNDTIEILPNVISAGDDPADLNGDGTIDVFDLLAYLDLWFASDPAADLDGTGPIDVFDLLIYLDLWFAGQ